MSSLMALQLQELTAHLNGVLVPPRHAEAASAPHVGPPFGIYATRDGYIALAMNPMDILGPLLALDDEFSKPAMNWVGDDSERLFLAISQSLKGKTTDDWMSLLLEADIWCAPVQDYEALENDPQVAHNRSIVSYEHPTAGTIRTIGPPVTFSSSSSDIRYPPPLLGEHTVEIAMQIDGMTAEKVKELLADEILFGGNP